MTAPVHPSFIQLNHGWNAEPNAPHPTIMLSGADVLLSFFVNPFQFPRFDSEDRGSIRFSSCARYRLGGTNDEGWSRGQCRYSSIAPAWGEFYELIGADTRLDEPQDWKRGNEASNADRHFLFYLRDETFECIATDWKFVPNPTNALFRHFVAAPR
jgi:hypothetical protein